VGYWLCLPRSFVALVMQQSPQIKIHNGAFAGSISVLLSIIASSNCEINVRRNQSANLELPLKKAALTWHKVEQIIF
jgi:hypothetical protein